MHKLNISIANSSHRLGGEIHSRCKGEVLIARIESDANIVAQEDSHDGNHAPVHIVDNPLVLCGFE